MSEEKRNGAEIRAAQFRYASLGLEFGAGIAGCVLLGYWVDRTFGTGHAGVVVGALVGCVGGMYHLVTQALRLQRQQEQSDQRRTGENDDQDSSDERTGDD